LRPEAEGWRDLRHRLPQPSEIAVGREGGESFADIVVPERFFADGSAELCKAKTAMDSEAAATIARRRSTRASRDARFARPFMTTTA
jgi:hypothetical protein